VYVNPAGVVCKSTSVAKLSDQFLQFFNILAVAKDGADQLYAIIAGGSYLLASLSLLARNAAVAHKLPNLSVLGRYLFGVVIVACVCNRSVKEVGSDFGRFVPCDASKLNLNPESACKHVAFLLNVYVLCLSACTYITLKGLYSKQIPRNKTHQFMGVFQ
jgi:hypothetical protein